MSGIFHVSQTKVNTYRRCRYAYFLRYVRKLRRKMKGRSLKFGGIAHEMLEAQANGDDPMVKLEELVKEAGKMFASERDEFRQMIEDAEDIMTDYFEFDWGKDALSFVRRKGKSAEHEFEVELAKGIILEGKLDAEAKTPDGRRWLVENKTFGKLPNEDHRWRNLQSNTYHRVRDMMGLPNVDGICWNYIGNHSPGVPSILKNGTVSLKRLNTVPSRLHRFFRQQKLKLRDHPTLMKSAEANQRHYFQRIFSVVKKGTVDLVFKDLIETSLEMADNHGKRSAKTIANHCDWCDYESLCRAELQDGDVDFVTKREYYVEKHTRKTEAVKG